MVNQRLVDHVKRELKNAQIDIARAAITLKHLKAREKELTQQLAEMEKLRKDDDTND